MTDADRLQAIEARLKAAGPDIAAMKLETLPVYEGDPWCLLVCHAPEDLRLLLDALRVVVR